MHGATVGVIEPRKETMRIVLLTGWGREHRFLANRLAEEVQIDAIIVERGARQGGVRRAGRRGLCHVLAKLMWRGFLWVTQHERKRGQALRAVLGNDATERFPDGIPVVSTCRVGSPQCNAVLNELSPDILVIYGTSIVPGETLKIPRVRSLNMHTGIAPYYRGTHCAFWPIVNGEPQMLGATVHECTDQIDGGMIFGVDKIVLDGTDTLHTIFAKCVRCGAELYVAVLREVIGGELKGTKQDRTLGTEYRGYMRTLWPELMARWRLFRGLQLSERESACGDARPERSRI